MASKLDISAAEMCAVCDYVACAHPRHTNDFMKKRLDGCLICPDSHYPTDCSAASNMAEHVHSKMHRTNVHKYNTVLSEIIVAERVCYAHDNEPASRREATVAYLYGRIMRADGVHGQERFTEAALAFIVRRTTTTALLQAFQSVYGCERVVPRGVCVVCLERPSTMMFSTCKHVCACMTCAEHLRQSTDDEALTKCPVCRVASEVVSVYVI